MSNDAGSVLSPLDWPDKNANGANIATLIRFPFFFFLALQALLSKSWLGLFYLGLVFS